MKAIKQLKILKILIIVLLPGMLFAQTTSPQAIVPSGAYFSNTTASLSWTVGEIATETFTSGINILTQGFQQPLSITITGIDLDLLVYLEGPFSGSQMNSTLNLEGAIPLSQPYNTLPWNYTGTESVGSIPNSQIVDWVLIELRDAPSPETALPTTIIGQKAAFVTKNGDVVGLDGSSILQFPSISFSQNLYAVVWHRNHLGIMSSTGLPHVGSLYAWDFSTSITQVYNGSAGYKEIATGVYGMPGGDANADGNINSNDKNIWAGNAGKNGYKQSDFNMDSQVGNQDKNDVYVPNTVYSSQVPQ